ncbi:hypothetical protein ACFOY4_30175 [Actinomadura syzygii]|uniref:Uncharacterized protein n=1 Tax=Actinomadura syzygii TaxID=1427538 RepID=A0A5D0TX41_9ACTN|nr:hypothetical protein [Actinomadura syzygii]TYC09419.1 hypothetical protein FXF65_34780 [Actinomadura syzygii]
MPAEYEYVGPSEILAAVRAGSEGVRIASGGDFAVWVAARGEDELAEPFTFVVGLDGVLRLAPRRSEHVACAGGRPVLSAGEISFVLGDGRPRVDEISNQSTGYCPDPASWPAVGEALDRAGLPHPGQFTDSIIFRRCPECGERNLVKEGHFFCAVCGAELPSTWNLSPEK